MIIKKFYPFTSMASFLVRISRMERMECLGHFREFQYLLCLLCMTLFALAPVFAGSDLPTARHASPCLNKENPGSLPVLLSLEHIGKDLHLTSLQRSVIAGLRNDYRSAAMKITEACRAGSSGSVQLQLKLDHLDASFNERVKALLNHHQRRRLREIERQVLGGTLLTAPSEQQFLNLTEAQKEKIALLAKDANKKASIINLHAGQGKLNYHRQIMALRKNRLHYASAMLKVLTPSQLEIWRSAQGAKLVF